MPVQAYPPGIYELSSQAIRGPCYGFRMSYDVSNWSTDVGIEVDFTILLSEDNGVTWLPGGGSTNRSPGPFFDRQGNPVLTGSLVSQVSRHEYDASNKFVRLASIWKDNLIVKVVMAVRNGMVNTDVTLTPIRTINQQQNVPDLHHSIALGAHASAAGGQFDASVTTAGITTTSGRVVAVDAIWFGAYGAGFSSITDSNSNGWSSSAVSEHGNIDGIHVLQKYNANITGGASHTFTFTPSGDPSTTYPFPGIVVTEISGATASPLDKTASGYDSSPNTTHTTPNTATLSQAAEFILGFGNVDNATAGSVSAPWTQIENITNDTTHEGWVTAYKIVAATTAVNYTFATAGGSGTTYHVSTWKEAPTTNIKTVAGLAQASIKTINGLAIASVKSVGGLT